MSETISVRFDLLHAYAEANNIDFNGLCRVVRDAIAEGSEQSRADAARYRYLVGVWGFTIAEDLFGITTGRNVSVELDAAIDENIDAHKRFVRSANVPGATQPDNQNKVTP